MKCSFCKRPRLRIRPRASSPLTVTTFKSDLPAVVSSGSTILRWDVAKDATQVALSPVPGAWFLAARNGIAGTLDLSPTPLEPGATYDIWLDITNAPMAPDFQSDVFSAYLQKEGETARAKIFDAYQSDRDPSFVDVIIGGMQPNLDKLVVAGDDATNFAAFDDFYLSAGYNATIPVATPSGGGPLPALIISRAGNQLQISWAAGTLQFATSVSGPWNPVPGATVSPYLFTPAGAQQFFRAAK
jgi:hypothetical protein